MPRYRVTLTETVESTYTVEAPSAAMAVAIVEMQIDGESEDGPRAPDDVQVTERSCCAEVIA